MERSGRAGVSALRARIPHASARGDGLGVGAAAGAGAAEDCRGCRKCRGCRAVKTAATTAPSPPSRTARGARRGWPAEARPMGVGRLKPRQQRPEVRLRGLPRRLRRAAPEIGSVRMPGGLKPAAGTDPKSAFADRLRCCRDRGAASGRGMAAACLPVEQSPGAEVRGRELVAPHEVAAHAVDLGRCVHGRWHGARELASSPRRRTSCRLSGGFPTRRMSAPGRKRRGAPAPTSSPRRRTWCRCCRDFSRRAPSRLRACPDGSVLRAHSWPRDRRKRRDA